MHDYVRGALRSLRLTFCVLRPSRAEPDGAHAGHDAKAKPKPIGRSVPPTHAGPALDPRASAALEFTSIPTQYQLDSDASSGKSPPLVLCLFSAPLDSVSCPVSPCPDCSTAPFAHPRTIQIRDTLPGGWRLAVGGARIAGLKR
ncbi:hypothetical protein B0H15DRAFT_944006 [Mycena belliarum]|uniref:Uncharacterized protein n=1 Tax=Mycena belliarum TaxID=1033014 RepID=A0AAD6XSS5_9AGAR|nr:hypothetical protein B0H15DRAFT_944006 [Mycena belliae]